MGPAWGSEDDLSGGIMQFDLPLPIGGTEQRRLPDKDPDLSDSTASGLAKIVKWHPAINYFGYLADRIMPMEWHPNERFSQLARNHPRWYRWAVFFDASVTALAACGVLTVLGIAVYKTVWL